MTGSTYLVAWRHSMDDVPIRLCDTLGEAMTLAEECPFSTGYEIAERLGIDCSTPVCFAVYEFENGRPVQIHFAKREDDA